MGYYHYEEMKAFLTPREVGIVLGISTYMAYRLIESEELKAIKIGRRYKVSAGELIRFIQSR